MFENYQVKLQFTNELMGGLPKHPDVIKSWLEARAPRRKPENAVSLDVLEKQVEEEVDAEEIEENKVWCGFKGDEKGIYVEPYQVKAHIKDCANQLQGLTKTKALRSKVANKVFIFPERIYLSKDSQAFVKEPDAYFEHPVHVMTMRGARSALKRNDYILKAKIAFEIRVLMDGVISETLLRKIFEYGSLHGFLAERGLGFGAYEFRLKKI